MADKKITTESIGSEIAGSLIATALFQVLVEKGLLTTDEADDVINRAASVVRDSVIPEERAALEILLGLQQRLHL